MITLPRRDALVSHCENSPAWPCAREGDTWIVLCNPACRGTWSWRLDVTGGFDVVTPYLDEYVRVVRRLDVAAVESMAAVLLGAWSAHRTVFCCGNGGSAASACHFVADLTKLTAPARGRPLRAMALTQSIPAISAIANDVAYEAVFVEQMRPFVGPHDVVVGFSTSGSSPNVIRALEYANAVGAITLGVTGRHGTLLQAHATQAIVVDSVSVQHIEDATMVVAHLLCLRLKELIAGASNEDVTPAERTIMHPRIMHAASATQRRPLVSPYLGQLAPPVARPE